MNFTVDSASGTFAYEGTDCVGSTSAPLINGGGIVPIYSASSTIQPGSWVSIFGTNLASAAATWNGDFPTLLGGTSVTINNKPAYLWYVSPGQINLQAPDDSATGTVPVTVTTAASTENTLPASSFARIALVSTEAALMTLSDLRAIHSAIRPFLLARVIRWRFLA